MSTPQYSEINVLLRRNEGGEPRNSRDVEDDMQRLLLMSRDHKLCDQMVQAQAVRRLILIFQASSSIGTRRYCAGILANLAHIERGRLSASSCDRWNCVSHRHNCPIYIMLYTAQCSSDSTLQHLSAAALLTFSIQTECHTQIELVSGIQVLLRLLDVRDADLNVYAAGILWNLIKSPLIMLKLESVHGILKSHLSRRLTDLLWTPLEPFGLSVRVTGERGITGIIDSDGDNLPIMIAASISTQLSIVIHIENYTGRPRTLADQYAVKSPIGRSGSTGSSEGISIARFDETGVLLARTCAVCKRAIKITKKSQQNKWLTCARDGCDQTYHVSCSRWKTLDEETHVRIHRGIFHCGVCVLQLPMVHYTDFIAENEKHAALLTETRFKTVGIKRFDAPSDITYTNGIPALAYVALLDRKYDVIAVGVKKYRIPATSQDEEMLIVDVRYVLIDAYPTTQQQSKCELPKPQTWIERTSDWIVSYAREGATRILITPGNTVFWPAKYVQDMDSAQYTKRSLVELEGVYLYEFQGGELPRDRAFSFAGRGISSDTEGPISENDKGLWSTMFARRGMCMKLLTEQMGLMRQMQELVVISSTLPDSETNQISIEKANESVNEIVRKSITLPKMKKPHIHKKLNKVVVVSTPVSLNATTS